MLINTQRQPVGEPITISADAIRILVTLASSRAPRGYSPQTVMDLQDRGLIGRHGRITRAGLRALGQWAGVA